MASGLQRIPAAQFVGRPNTERVPTSSFRSRKSLTLTARLPGRSSHVISTPSQWQYLAGALTPSQREQLAKDYESGNGYAASKALGEQGANILMTVLPGSDAARSAAVLNDASKISKAVKVGDGAAVGAVAKQADMVSTAINDSVKLVNQASLPRGIRSTFMDGQYSTVETTAPVTLFRKFGGTGDQAKANGGFATTAQNASRSDTAVFQKWSNQRFEAKLDIPEGSVLNIGKVAPQTSRSGNSIYHRGGADQVLLPKDYPTSWITSVRDGKTGITYTLDEFQKIFPNQIKK